MKKLLKISKGMFWLALAAMIIPFSCTSPVNSSSKSTSDSLVLVKTISLNPVNGRIDHMTINPKKQLLYIAALGNNSLEVVNLSSGKVVQSITKLKKPQGIVYIPSRDVIALTTGGDGFLRIFDATSFKQIKEMPIGDDADNLRYDSISNRLFVAYGKGTIAVVDAGKWEKTADIKLSAHPESFQLDKKKNRLYVNVPGSRQIEVVDLAKGEVTERWPVSDAKLNFTMAFDEASQTIFVTCRRPATLLIYNTNNGKMISKSPCSADADDIFYNKQKKECYISGGEGFMDVFRRTAKGDYERISRTATREGARTSLFVPELNEIILAVPRELANAAELRIYKIKR